MRQASLQRTPTASVPDRSTRWRGRAEKATRGAELSLRLRTGALAGLSYLGLVVQSRTGWGDAGAGAPAIVCQA